MRQSRLGLEPLEERRMLAFSALAPHGSQIYQQVISDSVSVGESDVFSVTLDPNQYLSLKLVPSGGSTLQGQITVTGPTSGSASASIEGETVLWETGAATGGTFTITISQLGSSAGGYTLYETLNAMVSRDELDPAINKSRETAESVDAAFSILDGDASHAGVLGIGTAGKTDYYSVTLAAGERVSVGMKVTTGSGNLRLTDAAGNTVKVENVPVNSNVTKRIFDYEAGSAGVYYLEVTNVDSDYSLIFTKNASFDNQTGSASLTFTFQSNHANRMMAHYGDGRAIDVYKFSVEAGKTAFISTSTPATGSGDFANSFDPVVTVKRDSNSALVATDDNSFGDGRNALLSFKNTGSTSLDYRIEVTGAGGSFGEYVLFVDRDPTPLSVVSVTPTSGSSITLPLTSVQVTFNQPYDPASVSTSNVSFDVGSVSSFNMISPTTIEYFVTINQEGTHNFRTSGIGLRSVLHGPSIPYTGSYTYEVGTISYPVTLTPVLQRGSRVYSDSRSFSIGTPTDTDTFTFALEANQTLSMIAVGQSGLQPRLTLTGPGVSLSNQASAAAGEASLSNVAISGGTYTLTVSGVGGSTGSYLLKPILNASLENEDHGGASNDSVATAQDLDAHFKSLGGNSRHAAVLGDHNNVTAGAITDYYSFSLIAGETVYLTLRDLSATSATATHVTLVNSAGTALATSVRPSAGTAVDSSTEAVNAYTAPTTGRYYARVNTAGVKPYNFEVWKNTTFDFESNSTIATAQPFAVDPSNRTGRAVGYVGLLTSGTDNVDAYKIAVPAFTRLTLTTATPTYVSGNSPNGLDPKLTIGSVVDDNSAGDGRNARLIYDSISGETVDVQVGRIGATGGDYILLAETKNIPHVLSTDPADGSVLALGPSSIIVNFSEPILTSSLNAGDLTVDGNSATGYSVIDADTIRWFLPAVSGDGDHTIRILTGAVSDTQNTPNAEYVGHIVIDTGAPEVVSSSIQQGGNVTGSNLAYVVGFSEPIASFSADDIQLLGGLGGSFSPSSYSLVGSTLTVNYSNLPEDAYTLTLKSGPAGFLDSSGRQLDGEPMWPLPPNQSGNGVDGGDFFVQFTLDSATKAFPTPLAARQPLGSLVYAGSTSTNIGLAGDTDSFTINLDAGQSLTVIADPSGSLQPTISVTGPGGAVGSTSAPAAGQTAVLQTAPINAAGLYTITIGGAGSSTGATSVEVNLNAAAESEAEGGPSNDALAGAQDLDGAFVSLGGAGSRAAVLGIGGGTDHFSFTLSTGDVVSLALGGSGTLKLLNSAGTQVALGSLGVNADRVISGYEVLSPGTYYAQLSGGTATDYNLTIVKNALFDTEPNGSTASAPVLEDGGQALGGLFTDLAGTTLSENFESGALNSNWTTYVSHHGNIAKPNGFGDVSVVSPGLSGSAFALRIESFDQIEVGFGNIIYEATWTPNFATNSHSKLSFTYAATGTVVSSPTVYLIAGSTSFIVWNAIQPNASTSNIDLSAAAAAHGVTLGPNVQLKFSLVRNYFTYEHQNFFFDNITITQAETERDYYRVALGVGQSVTLQTDTPGDTGQFANALDPILYLYSPAGALLSSNDNGAADGRNALLAYTATTAGDYFVAVGGWDYTKGEYTLSAAVDDALILGDMNGDGEFDNFDIQAFELALADPEEFALQHPDVTNVELRGDMNGDGDFDNFDIGAFEAALTGGALASASTNPVALPAMASTLSGTSASNTEPATGTTGLGASQLARGLAFDSPRSRSGLAGLRESQSLVADPAGAAGARRKLAILDEIHQVRRTLMSSEDFQTRESDWQDVDEDLLADLAPELAACGRPS